MQEKLETTQAEAFKDDVARIYAAQKNISETEAKERITDVLEVIALLLIKGYIVKLHRFFNFFPKERGEKETNVPATGVRMVIPATKTVVVQFTRSLKARIQGKL